MKMKNLFLVAALVLGVAISGHAVDFKANGAIKTGASWNAKNNISIPDQKGAFNDFEVEQWAYTDFSFIANENLKGVVNLIFANENNWGDSNLKLGGDYSVISNKSYIEFSVPNTGIQTKVGFDDFVTASPQVASEEMGYLQLHAPIYGDMLGLTVAYARPWDKHSQTAAANTPRESMDLYYAALPVKMDNVTVTPFYMNVQAPKKAVDALTNTTDGYDYPSFNKYALFGPNAAKAGGMGAEGGLRAQWFGVNAAASVMDFDIAFDFDYGKTSGMKKGSTNNNLRRKGFWSDLTIDYNGFANFKPAVFVGYGSGDKEDKNTNEGGIMPSLGGAKFAVGNYYYGNDAVAGSGVDVKTYNGGYMVAGIAVKDICLLDKLTHDVWAYYTKGTNDPKAAYSGNSDYKNLYLTKDDHLYHVDLTTKYQIFEELTAALELSYVDVSMKADTTKRTNMKTKNLHKIGIGLNYSF